MARRLTATMRPCLAAGAAIVAVVAVLQVPSDSARDRHSAAPQQTEESAALRTARDSGKPIRVASLTSETTEVYALPDGQFRADISTGMQRFRRAGAWVAVDQTLTARPDGSIGAAAHPGDLQVSGPQPAGEHELAAVGLGARRVAMSWTGTLPTPRLAGTRATYADVRPGVDLVVAATRQGFEQYLVLKSRAAADQVASVTYGFSGPGAAKAARTRTGSIALTGADGAASAEIPAPLMWDAKTSAVRRPVEVGLAGTDLTLKPDLAWLRDPATAYPVTIDPTLNPAVTTFDTYVRESVTSDQSAERDLQIGLLPTTPPTLTRSFLTWNTTVLAGTQITSATVALVNGLSHT